MLLDSYHSNNMTYPSDSEIELTEPIKISNDNSTIY